MQSLYHTYHMDARSNSRGIHLGERVDIDGGEDDLVHRGIRRAVGFDIVFFPENGAREFRCRGFKLSSLKRVWVGESRKSEWVRII